MTFNPTHQKSKHIFRRFTNVHRNTAPKSEFMMKQAMIRIPSAFDTFICCKEKTFKCCSHDMNSHHSLYNRIKLTATGWCLGSLVQAAEASSVWSIKSSGSPKSVMSAVSDRTCSLESFPFEPFLLKMYESRINNSNGPGCGCGDSVIKAAKLKKEKSFKCYRNIFQIVVKDENMKL